MKPITTKRLVGISLFGALGFVTMLFVRIPVPPFLTLDLKDAVMTLGAILYGSVVGPILSLLIALIELITVSDKGIYGFLMNFVGSATFSFVLPFFFRRKRNLRGFLLGSGLAVFSLTVVMIFANLLITPHYSAVPFSAVIAMIPTVLLPFNVAKGLINALAVLALYPSVSLAARKAKIADDLPDLGISPSSKTGEADASVKRNVRIFVIAAIVAALIASGLLIFIFLG